MFIEQQQSEFSKRRNELCFEFIENSNELFNVEKAKTNKIKQSRKMKKFKTCENRQKNMVPTTKLRNK